MAGFILSTVADRIKALDFEAFAWKQYTALTTLAVVRGTARRTLENKVFGQDKPSESFRQAFQLGELLYSNGFTSGEQATVGELPIEEALKFTLGRLDAHMLELGVNGKNAYRGVAKYASKAALDAALAKAAEDEAAEKAEAETLALATAALAETAAAAEAEAKAEALTLADTLAEEAEPSLAPMLDLTAAALALSDDDLATLAGVVHAELMRRAEMVRLEAETAAADAVGASVKPDRKRTVRSLGDLKAA